MKYYAEFTNNSVVPCGSDSVLILDGRWKLETMVQAAYKRLQLFKKNFPTKFDGFIIRQGERFDDNNPILYRY